MPLFIEYKLGPYPEQSKDLEICERILEIYRDNNNDKTIPVNESESESEEKAVVIDPVQFNDDLPEEKEEEDLPAEKKEEEEEDLPDEMMDSLRLSKIPNGPLVPPEDISALPEEDVKNLALPEEDTLNASNNALPEEDTLNASSNALPEEDTLNASSNALPEEDTLNANSNASLPVDVKNSNASLPVDVKPEDEEEDDAVDEASVSEVNEDKPEDTTSQYEVDEADDASSTTRSINSKVSRNSKMSRRSGISRTSMANKPRVFTTTTTTTTDNSESDAKSQTDSQTASRRGRASVAPSRREDSLSTREPTIEEDKEETEVMAPPTIGVPREPEIITRTNEPIGANDDPVETQQQKKEREEKQAEKKVRAQPQPQSTEVTLSNNTDSIKKVLGAPKSMLLCYYDCIHV